MEKQKILYGCEDNFGVTTFFPTKEQQKLYLKKCTKEAVPVTVEYLGAFGNRCDVIKKITSRDTVFITAIDSNYLAVYNPNKSQARGWAVWDGEPGSLEEIYGAFEQHGIKLQHDPYEEERMCTANLEKAFQKLKTRNR